MLNKDGLGNESFTITLTDLWSNSFTFLQDVVLNDSHKIGNSGLISLIKVVFIEVSAVSYIQCCYFKSFKTEDNIYINDFIRLND